MYTILVLTLSGSVLALLLMCLRYIVLRKMPSTVYYYAWLLILLRFALPIPGFIPTSGGSEDATPAPSASAVYSEMKSQENIPENTRHNIQEVSEFNQSNIAKNVSTETERSHIAVSATESQEMTVSETAPEASFSIDWRSPKLWLSIWASGFVVSMGITVFAYLKFCSGLKRNLMEPDSFTKAVYASIQGRKPALYFSDSARTPMMLGVFKPKIVLPHRKYDEELLLNILRHELTHYRRFDALYKWASVVILSAHWFNPIAWFIRRELNRACEMSCDEMLLRTMNRAEKQSYGDSLLLMAASSALPTAVVATSFATDKNNLKERLVQIMNYKKSGTRLLASVLAVALITGCGVAAGPGSSNESEDQTTTLVSENVLEEETTGSVSGNDSETMVVPPKSEDGVVRVKNVDEFLVSIAPHTVIELAEGVYDLTTASDYAKDSKSEYYSWNGLNDDGENGAELVIHDVKDLTIRGAGIDKTSIVAVLRCAYVISFTGCRNLTLSDFTAGHTMEPDPCRGGVLGIENCSDTNVDSCGFYGCGTIGVDALNCERVNVTNCDIYECSVSAVKAMYSEDVLVSGCDIHNHGTRTARSIAYYLFDVIKSTGVTVYNCNIHDNSVQGLLYTTESQDIFFFTNEVTKNTIKGSVFHLDQECATVDGCHFESNDITRWYKSDSKKPTDINGNELDAEQYTAMELRDIEPDTVISKSGSPTPAMKADEVDPGTEINVTTIDEFLSAIGPDRTIVLDGTNFNLYEAANYGGESTEFYDWEERSDGPQLVIHDVKNLTIKAKNTDPAATTLEAYPRYANVLVFMNCYQVTVSGFTAGHTKDKGLCAGGVLYFNDCEEIKVEKMRLYGCGDMGIDTFMCSGIDVINTEIYECTSGAVFFTDTKEINLKDCNIHDVPSPALAFDECNNITWNGQKLSGSFLRYDVKDNGALVAVK